MKKFLVAFAAVAAVVAAGTAEVPELVTKEAGFWFDASTLAEEAGASLDTWNDVRGEGYPSLSTYTATKPQVIRIADGALAGKKAVTFFTVGTECDMRFPSTQEIKTAFFVVDIDQEQYAFLLGGPSNGTAPYNYGFHRNSGGAYRYQYSITSVQYWNDGRVVAAPQTDKIPTGYQLITWGWGSSAQVLNICSDRSISGRIGGKRLCEVVAFSRELNIAERSIVEGYLKTKWWPGSVSEANAATLMLGRKAQVHFDAAEASSFHFDIVGNETAVSQWDDLSGNDNHFTPGETWGTNHGINYGTVGTVAEKPVFNAGAVSSGIDLKLASRITNTRTVFIVTEIDRAEHAFWLGDSPNASYRFHRGTGGQYSNPAYSYIDKYGAIWANGCRIVNQGQQYPEPNGGLTVYTLRSSQNCEWSTLGQDRNISNRNGGKRVAEILTFSEALGDAERIGIEALLTEKWRPSDEYVDAIIAAAPVHVDASSGDNFNYSGGAITGWKNQGTGADLVKPAKLYKESDERECYPGSYGYTNGVPAFLMGPHSSYIDMYFTRLTNVRTIFWAMDIVRDKEAFFLADGKNEVIQNASSYHFHRGIGASDLGCYASAGYSASGYKNGPMYCDDNIVVSMTTERPPFGAHVFDISSYENLTASSISADRWCNDRNGGRAISELLILTVQVSGLTRKAIRDRIAAKWTRSCGWAGAGDAEWGAGKYRVFGADAAVPAEGATADGVGFTASAELSGGALTLGDGGFFASEGVTSQVSAPIAGKLGVYGPGTVHLTQKLDTLDSLSIGYGATLLLPPAGAVTGTLCIQEKGRLVLDVSGLAEKEHAVITFGNVALPAGGTLYDYVALSGGEGHFFSVSADGRELHVNSPNVALTAEWTAAESVDVTSPANWVCRNLVGEVVEGLIPGRNTEAVTFSADCDLRVLGQLAFADGVVFDLNGHAVKVAGFEGQGYPLSSVTNSALNAGAELHVDVAGNLNITNSTVVIGGNVKLVKDGEGTLIAAKAQQPYTGGNEVTAGVLGAHYNLRDSRNYAFGAKGSTFVLREGSTFKMNGMYAQADAVYKFVLDGGTLMGCEADVPDSYGEIHLIELTANSTFAPTTNCGLVPGGSFSATTLDLGGYTLTVPIGTNNKNFFLYNTTVKNGTLNITSGGWLSTKSGATVNATDVDVIVGSALNLKGTISVRNYEQVYGSDNNSGTAAFNVYGVFKPAAEHNYFYGCTMQDGSTIDLSGKTGAWSTKSAFSSGLNTVTFADGATVTIKLEGREDLKALSESESPYVVTWPLDDAEQPVEPTDVTFVSDEWTEQNRFLLRKDAKGLKLLYNNGTLIIFL